VLNHTTNTLERVAFDLMFPDSDNFPAALAQEAGVPLVTRAVPRNLLSPELIHPVLPYREPPPMPEIAMNKNNQLLPRKNKIWRAGKPCIVFGKRQARGNEQIADVPFRCRIFAADTGHQSPSFLGRHDVRHRVLLHIFISFLQSYYATTARTLRYLIPPRALATGSGKSISSWILGVSLSKSITSVKRRRPCLTSLANNGNSLRAVLPCA